LRDLDRIAPAAERVADLGLETRDVVEGDVLHGILLSRDVTLSPGSARGSSAAVAPHTRVCYQRRVAGRVALVIVIACARAASASVPVGHRAPLEVAVHNGGARPVPAAAPEVVYSGRSERGETIPELAPGERHGWVFDLPRPAEPGSIPAVIRVRYTGDDGRRAALPVVATVSTPGLLPVPEVRATLTTSPVTRFARAVLLLDNPLPAPVHGRVVVVLPHGLTIEPESQPVEVPAQGRSEVPLMLQNRDEPPGVAVPIFALFDYDLDGRRHLAIASTSADVAGGRSPSPAPPSPGAARRSLPSPSAAARSVWRSCCSPWRGGARRDAGPTRMWRANPQHSHA